MPAPALVSPPALVAPQATAHLQSSTGAATGPSGDEVDYTTRRYEPAGFPIIGGNSDIGFQFGATATLSFFENGVKPYAWNADILASMSFKGGEGPGGGGIEVAQQSYLANVDWPGLVGGHLRITPQLAYSRTINENYFGLGNASSAARPPGAEPSSNRFHEFVQNLVYTRWPLRVQAYGPIAWMMVPAFRYVVPETYANSDLERDERTRRPDGSPLVLGTRPVSLPSVAGGFIYDSRDNEIFPRSGMYHQAGVRYEHGFPSGNAISYGEGGIILSGFVPVAGPLIFASRLLVDMEFGNVPFFDLFESGPFQLKEAPGGSTGVRGVPIGRYLGPIKVVANAEFRALLVRFKFLGQRFSVGGDMFFDTGRVWSDYSFHSPLEGSGLGLKYGVGAGMYWLWGQAAIFRVEAAYSPDAASENQGFPLGLYLEDGTMF
jgi:hypothetical protein